MKAHGIDTFFLLARSRSSAKVKVKYQGHVSQKMGVSGALVFHKHILFCLGYVEMSLLGPDAVTVTTDRNRSTSLYEYACTHVCGLIGSLRARHFAMLVCILSGFCCRNFFSFSWLTFLIFYQSFSKQYILDPFHKHSTGDIIQQKQVTINSI